MGTEIDELLWHRKENSRGLNLSREVIKRESRKQHPSFAEAQ